MQVALREIFVEDNPHCTEADYAEHPEAFLSYGHDNPESEDYMWTVYTIAVNRDGSGTYTRYRDQDDRNPDFERGLAGLTLTEASALWGLLADGKIDAVQERIETS